MYQTFYGFSEMPFNITPDPKFLYLSPSHLDALQHLKYGIAERKGFIVLTGEVGCGKTTLCRRFLNELPPDRYDTALVLNPRINETEMLETILLELGERIENSSTNALVSQIYNALLKRILAGKDIVLIIDECQNLTFEVLEQVRLLSNLETDKQKLLQIVLMGQPEFKEKIRQERLRQLRQRILVYYDLNPLTREDVEHYIQHRLTLAGANGRPAFTRWAIRSIYRRSKGVPRIINNLCDKALLAAYVRESYEVNWFDVRRALKEISALSS